MEYKYYLLVTRQCDQYPNYYFLRAKDIGAAKPVIEEIFKKIDIPKRQAYLFLTSTMRLSYTLNEIMKFSLIKVMSLLKTETWMEVGSPIALGVFGGYQGFIDWTTGTEIVEVASGEK